jgi:hypothetical protein
MTFGATKSKCSGIVANKGDPFAGVAGLRAEIARLDTHIGGVVLEIVLVVSIVDNFARPFKILWCLSA